MNLLFEILFEILRTLLLAAPYLLFGLLIAGFGIVGGAIIG